MDILDKMIVTCESLKIPEKLFKIQLLGNLPEELQYIPANESKTSSTELFPIYIVLTKSNTLLAPIITRFTNSEYSHSSIAFDPDLKELYSFGYKFDKDNNVIKKNPLMAECGFTRENIHNQYTDKDFCIYGIYVTFVTKSELLHMKKKVMWFDKMQSKFSFSNMGLIRNYFHIETHDKYKRFCSQFVSEILNAGKKNFTQKTPSLMKPCDFQETPNVYFVKKGIIKDYNGKEIKKLTDKLLRSEKIRLNALNCAKKEA